MKVAVDRRRARRPRGGAAPPGRGLRRHACSSSAPEPGGRAAQLRDGRLHLGHRPVADHDAVGARGDVRGRRARSARRGRRCAGSTRSTGSAGRATSAAFDFCDSPERLREEVARFSARDARRVDDFLAALRPIYEQGILGAGRRAFGDLRSFAALVPALARLGAIVPLHRFVARHFEHPRVREAFSFHSLFIGGDPFRVPGDLRGARLPPGARRRLVRRRRRLLASSRRWRAHARRALRRARDGDRVERGRRVTRRAARRRRARRRRRRGLERRRAAPRTSCSAAARARRPLRPTMSCFLLYLGTDRRVRATCCTTRCSSARGYREFIRTSRAGARCRRRSRPTCTPRRAPRRRWRRPAATRSRPAAGAQPARGDRLGARWATACATRSSRDLEATLRADRARRVGARGAPHDAARLRARARRRRRQRVRGRADAAPVGLLPAAQPRARRRRALPRRRRDASRAPGSPACCSAPRSRPGSWPTRARPRRCDVSATPSAAADLAAPRRVAEARATTRRVARTFALACRLLPRDVRDDVYLLYLVFRTLDDLVDEGRPEAAERVAAVEAWAAGRRRRPRRARSPILDGLARAAPAAARRVRRLLRRHAPRPRARDVRDRGRASTATATAWPAPSAS